MELIPRPLLRSAPESLGVLGNSPKARRSVGGSAGFVRGVLGRRGVWRPQRGLSGGASLAGLSALVVAAGRSSCAKCGFVYVAV